jgi:hypothetical protein
MKNIINFYYINNLKIKNNSVPRGINFSKLLIKINEKSDINIPEKLEALLFLKNIFQNYDFLEDSNILEKIPSFKTKYFGTNLEDLKHTISLYYTTKTNKEYEQYKTTKEYNRYKEIEYFLFFLKKLLLINFENEEIYIDKIAILLDDYANISSSFYNNDSDTLRRT